METGGAEENHAIPIRLHVYLHTCQVDIVGHRSGTKLELIPSLKKILKRKLSMGLTGGRLLLTTALTPPVGGFAPEQETGVGSAEVVLLHSHGSPDFLVRFVGGEQ